MDQDLERRRKAGVAITTARYLRYININGSDVGFSTQGFGSLQQLRQATLDAHLIVRTNSRLALSDQGRVALNSPGAHAN
jgi:hypothetical protein